MFMEKRSPMVSIPLTPKLLSARHRIVIRIMATSEPGSFLLILGVNIIVSMLSTPMSSDHQLIVSQCRKYTTHLSMNPAGTLST